MGAAARSVGERPPAAGRGAPCRVALLPLHKWVPRARYWLARCGASATWVILSAERAVSPYGWDQFAPRTMDEARAQLVALRVAGIPTHLWP